MGVRAEPLVTADCAGLTVEALGNDLAEPRRLLAWFAEAVDSGFALPHGAGDLPALKRLTLARLPPGDRWADTVRGALFADRHRYGIGHRERAAHLAQCGPEDVREAARELLRAPPVLALSLPEPLASGARGMAAQGAGSCEQGLGSCRPVPGAAAPVIPRQPVRVPVPDDGGTVFYLLGTPGVALTSADKFAFHVAWAMLGGREGMLDRRLRGERASTCSLAAFSRELAEGGYRVCCAGCAAGALDEVADRTAAVLRELGEGHYDPSLVVAAKERLIIRNHRLLQTGRGVTERLCGYEIAGADPGLILRYAHHIARVTPDQVSAAARRCAGT